MVRGGILALLALVALCGVACSGLEPYDASKAAEPATVRASGAEPGEGPSDADSNDALGDPDVFIDVARMLAMGAEGATLLDARPGDAYARGHVPGARHAPWERFVDGAPGERSGLLSDDLARLGRELSAAGVRASRPVVVYGQWDGAWGEEGRIFWMLEYLGHRDVHILQGGVDAYVRAGHALSREPSGDASGAVGDFEPAPRAELRATAAQVLSALEGGDAVILDSRTLAEYDGLTPHGSARGGHIPRALHFHWHDVFDDSGALLPPATLRARFAAMGIGERSLVIAYCTGGVRSGFIYAVMRWAGHGAPRNYDGSFWEWSARAELPVAR